MLPSYGHHHHQHPRQHHLQQQRQRRSSSYSQFIRGGGMTPSIPFFHTVAAGRDEAGRVQPTPSKIVFRTPPRRRDERRWSSSSSSYAPPPEWSHQLSPPPPPPSSFFAAAAARLRHLPLSPANAMSLASSYRKARGRPSRCASRDCASCGPGKARPINGKNKGNKTQQLYWCDRFCPGQPLLPRFNRVDGARARRSDDDDYDDGGGRDYDADDEDEDMNDGGGDGTHRDGVDAAPRLGIAPSRRRADNKNKNTSPRNDSVASVSDSTTLSFLSTVREEDGFDDLRRHRHRHKHHDRDDSVPRRPKCKPDTRTRIPDHKYKEDQKSLPPRDAGVSGEPSIPPSIVFVRGEDQQQEEEQEEERAADDQVATDNKGAAQRPPRPSHRHETGIEPRDVLPALVIVRSSSRTPEHSGVFPDRAGSKPYPVTTTGRVEKSTRDESNSTTASRRGPRVFEIMPSTSSESFDANANANGNANAAKTRAPYGCARGETGVRIDASASNSPNLSPVDTPGDGPPSRTRNSVSPASKFCALNSVEVERKRVDGVGATKTATPASDDVLAGSRGTGDVIDDVVGDDGTGGSTFDTKADDDWPDTVDPAPVDDDGGEVRRPASSSEERVRECSRNVKRGWVSERIKVLEGRSQRKSSEAGPFENRRPPKIWSKSAAAVPTKKFSSRSERGSIPNQSRTATAKNATNFAPQSSEGSRAASLEGTGCPLGGEWQAPRAEANISAETRAMSRDDAAAPAAAAFGRANQGDEQTIILCCRKSEDDPSSISTSSSSSGISSLTKDTGVLISAALAGERDDALWDRFYV